jgi:hypothetical protein
VSGLGVLAVIAATVVVIAAPIVLLIHFYHLARKYRRPRPSKARKYPSAFPVMSEPIAAIPLVNDGPGRYRIIDVVAKTGTDTKMFIHADTLANAKVKAELRGVVVTEITKQ